jgi:hypothetical protein
LRFAQRAASGTLGGLPHETARRATNPIKKSKKDPCCTKVPYLVVAESFMESFKAEGGELVEIAYNEPGFHY